MGSTNVPKLGRKPILNNFDRGLVVLAGLPWATFASDEKVEKVKHRESFGINAISHADNF